MSRTAQEVRVWKLQRAIAKHDYSKAVYKMLRCVSVVSTAEFIDLVNEVIKQAKNIQKYNLTPEEAMEFYEG